MDRVKLEEELKLDEGCVYEVYEDHLGYATFGIGHLVKESDEEYGQALGTPVSEERVTKCFNEDIDTVCEELDKNHLPLLCKISRWFPHQDILCLLKKPIHVEILLFLKKYWLCLYSNHLFSVAYHF